MVDRSQSKAMPLTMLQPGHSARVSGIASRGRGVTQKLTAMGIAPGAELSVLNTRGGPLLVRIGDSRIALGRGMAHRVMVLPVR